jgi:hypothetical protein
VPAARRVIRMRSGHIDSVVCNDQPVPMEEIAW